MRSIDLLQCTCRAAVYLLAGTFLFSALTASAQDNQKKVSFEGSVDIVSPYYFRGAKIEDSGLILQPDAAVTFGLEEGIQQVGSTYVKVGLWNSIHSKQTSEGLVTGSGLNDAWYEADFYAHIGAIIADNYITSVEYVAYNYPNGSNLNVQEVGLRLTYDDREVLGEYSVTPYILWVFEVSGTNSPSISPMLPGIGIPQVANNFTEHQYIEAGLGKTFVIVASETTPVKLHVPLTFGLSFDGYYLDSNDNTQQLGYVDLGALVSMPLPEMSNAGYGNWEVYAGANVLWINSHYLKDLNGRDEWGVAGRAGVKVSF